LTDEYFQLLDQPADFKCHLTAFFDKNRLPHLSWLFSLDERRYEQAATSLLEVAPTRTEAESKEVSGETEVCRLVDSSSVMFAAGIESQQASERGGDRTGSVTERGWNRPTTSRHSQ
jgi:hypothetical protein